MYDEKDSKKGIQWGNLLRGAIKFIVIIIALFLIIFVVTKCTRGIKNIKTNTGTATSKITLSSQLDSLQKATIKYANEGNLPTAAYASKTVRLKELQEQGMIKNLTDSKGNACSATGTYARITKLENNYMTRLNVVCNKKTESKTVYIGCFSDCGDGKVCLGSKNKLEGLCNAPAKQAESTAPKSNTSNSNTSSNTSSTSKGDPNSSFAESGKSSNASSFDNSGRSTSASSFDNSGNTSSQRTSTPTTRTMYEFKKYKTSYACASGVLEGDKCLTITRPHYEYDMTIGKHIFTCEGNTVYRIVNNQKQCVSYSDATASRTVVDTTWSYSTYLAGYERTGNTKQVTE